MPKPLMTFLRFVCVATVLAATHASAGDFLDFRLSFSLVDENFLVKPGETVPSIPGVRFGAPIPRWGLLFFDNYDTRFTGFENLTNMVLYKEANFGAEQFEGAFVLRFNSVSDNLSAIYDGGSYVKWTHWFDPTRENKVNISFTAFPFSSDLFRLGYSYKISWGGSQLLFKANPDNPFAGSIGGQNTSAVPGARLQFAGEKAYAFFGAKTSLMLNQADNQQEPIYGFLAGGGYDFNNFFRLEANGGYFYRGTNPIPAVLGRPVVTYGLSAQAVLHSGVPVGRSGDFPTYKNDPSSVVRIIRPEEYPGGLSWLVSAEATVINSTLQDASPDKAASTVNQPAVAADLNARIKYEHWRIHADLLYQDMSYLLVNVPSFVPFQALSSQTATTSPQTFAAAGADYFFENQRLTLGLTMGLESPATFQGKLPANFVNDLPPDAVPASATVVVRTDGLYDILPAGFKTQPVYAAKINATLSYTYFNIVLDVLTAYDSNITHLMRINNDPLQIPTRIFTNPWQLGFNLAFQARL